MRIRTRIHAHDEDNKESKLDGDPEALMDKYDDNEKKP